MLTGNNQKISIITACYNSESYIEETILSVINQTYSNIEYIIVDGASADGTMKIVEKYKEHIDTIISEPDNGNYEAYNKGIQASTADIIYFLNSDDYLYDEFVIENVAKYFMDNQQLSILYGNVLIKDSKDNMEMLYGRRFELIDFKYGNMPPHQAFFVKKSLFDRFGLFDLNYEIASDFDFVIKCFKEEIENSFYLNKTIAVFRTGGGSTNYKTRVIGLKAKEQIIQKHFNVEVDLSLTEMNNNALYRLWLEKLLLEDSGITKSLKKYKVRNVVIFGSMKTAIYLLKDLQKEKFHVVGFIDNNVHMQGKFIENVKVFSREWLTENQKTVDAVIMSIESKQGDKLISQLAKELDPHIVIMSWKQLVEPPEAK
ncbi:glycosyltransferase [Metabacillus herbersteinensis]|uniref:Glycosyltransferase n=1 Tax=Metabacillus herbersteinensis TaxID=283816 RepID=A0ABV6GFG5_9BACI